MLALHAVGERGAHHHIGDGGREHDGVEDEDGARAPAPEDGNEKYQANQIAEEAIRSNAPGVARRGKPQPGRREEQRAGGKGDNGKAHGRPAGKRDAGDGEPGVRGVRLPRYGREEDHASGKQHHRAENGHDGRDDAKRRLRGSLRDRGNLVLLSSRPTQGQRLPTSPSAEWR